MKIGVIGGSGVYQLHHLGEAESVRQETPFSEVPLPVLRFRPPGAEVCFIPRHGADHSVPPHQVNYRANLHALYLLGVECLLSFNAVGGISAPMVAGQLVVPDQLVDYTWGREHTFVGTGVVTEMHIDFSWPFAPRLREAILGAALAEGISVWSGGTYGCTQGPRLETAAEITRLARDGCDIVGMTAMPEAALARELGLPYACLALVVNRAAGLEQETIVMEDMQRVMAEGTSVMQALLPTILRQLGAEA